MLTVNNESPNQAGRVTPDKPGHPDKYFSYFSIKIYVVGIN